MGHYKLFSLYFSAKLNGGKYYQITPGADFYHYIFMKDYHLFNYNYRITNTWNYLSLGKTKIRLNDFKLLTLTTANINWNIESVNLCKLNTLAATQS